MNIAQYLLGSLFVAFALTTAHAAAPAPTTEPEPGAAPSKTSAPLAAAKDSDLVAFQTTKKRIRDLLQGTLDGSIDPQSLFDVALDDEDKLRIEQPRLQAVIAHAGQTALAKGPSHTLDTKLLAARLDLDRARLDFYALAQARREELLHEHFVRQQAYRPAPAVTSPADAAREAKEVSARLLEQDKARLQAASRAQADFEAALAKDQASLKQRAEQTLTLRRRVREVLLAQPGADSSAANSLYDELRTFLRASRHELAEAISLSFGDSGVPELTASPVADLPDDVDRGELEKSRQELIFSRQRLIALELGYRIEHASQLYDEVRALNLDRLALLARLSPSKRSDITSFTLTGLDQATAELTQVGLVLRYHLVAARRWVVDLGHSQSQRVGSLFATSFTLVKWLLLGAAFWWWRRQSGAILEKWRDRIRQEQRRLRIAQPSRLYYVLGLAQQTRQPLEWLLFFWLLVWQLPAASRDHMEVAVTTTIVSWILGGSLAVGMIDALMRNRTPSYLRMASMQTDQVRLRSLRLAGRTVVVLGLFLALNTELVGKGTIYSWAFSVCWFAAVPVVLVIIRWWRDIIFARAASTRKKKAFDLWVVAHQTGWKSFPAAVSAGAYLFLGGAWHVTRNWLTGFDLTRRVLAQIFRRGMDRRAEEKTAISLQPLPAELFAALGPETESKEVVPASADDKLDAVVERITRAGGGIFAVVGERGRGKTTVLKRVSSALEDVILVDCPVTGLEGLRKALVTATSAEPAASIEQCTAQLDASSRGTGLLIDHAHRLIQPTMGGLAAFDWLFQIARNHSSRCAWFFAFNEVIWRYFERAMDSRLLFDDVVSLEAWREEEIARLLPSRSQQAGVDPDFKHVMETLPADADEEDRAEAIARVATGYYRLIWDYSGGNVGVALHTWRRLLGVDGRGRICVKLFQVPDTKDLEQLSEAAAFILKAIIQLEPAQPHDVMRATMLGAPQVEDVLRYGVAHGYFKRIGERYRVTWEWFRPITRFLQRRHLLASY